MIVTPTNRFSIVLCMGVFFMLLSCYPSPSPYPTLGPVSHLAGRPDLLSVKLAANTNCAESGEEVIFTLTVRNMATYPITITNEPALDIVLRANTWSGAGPALVQTWSTTSTYPAPIHPVFTPGESRTYTWAWNADSVYADPPAVGVVATSTVISLYHPDPARSFTDVATAVSEIFVGVGFTSEPGVVENVRIPCRDLPRARA